MVHKKSEYNLQYHQLTQDLRKEIWQQNIKFREQHRSLNQAHHYWTYQVSEDSCQCDSDRVDHQAGAGAGAAQGQAQGHAEAAQAQAHRVEERRSESCPGKMEREVGCQTPDWKVDASSSRWEERGAEAVEALLPAEKPLRREKTAPPAVVRSRSPTRFSQQVSRTSRKAFSQQSSGSQRPFTSYGWNDSSRDVGTKKTYNVRAPRPEVYQPALRAQRLRREEMEQYLRWEAATAAAASSRTWDHGGKVVNHSSVWMSEYQEQFSERAARAQSAPPPLTRKTWC